MVTAVLFSEFNNELREFADYPHPEKRTSPGKTHLADYSRIDRKRGGNLV